MDVVFDSGYEAEAWQQIQRWEQEAGTTLGAAFRLVGMPAALVTNAAFRLPVVERGAERLTEASREGVRRLADGLDTDAVLAALSDSAGRPVRALGDVRRLDLSMIDARTRGLDRKYIAVAGATGGAAGAIAAVPGVGLPLAVAALGADVAASTAALLQAIATYGTYYGRDLTTPEESTFAVGLLGLGAVVRDSQARQLVLAELHTVSAALARGATWAELSRHTSVTALQSMFDTFGARLTKRKLAQVFPIAGAVVGGTVGSALADATCQSAYMQYRRRYLLDKYPGLVDRPPGLRGG
jgi:hypothetical protein